MGFLVPIGRVRLSPHPSSPVVSLAEREQAGEDLALSALESARERLLTDVRYRREIGDRRFARDLEVALLERQFERLGLFFREAVCRSSAAGL